MYSDCLMNEQLIPATNVANDKETLNRQLTETTLLKKEITALRNVSVFCGLIHSDDHSSILHEICYFSLTVQATLYYLDEVYKIVLQHIVFQAPIH